MLVDLVPAAWRERLAAEFNKDYWTTLETRVSNDCNRHGICPPSRNIFLALKYVTPAQVKVVLLGQDPYPNSAHAHGLAFSVPDGVRAPYSLQNILQELHDDIGHGAATTNLSSWARQGVLLLNAALTTRAGAIGSHRKLWQPFTDAVIKLMNRRKQPVVFVLWGRDARDKAALVTNDRHEIIESVHPSPQSAHGGFFGSRPFSKVNRALERFSVDPIDWSL